MADAEEPDCVESVDAIVYALPEQPGKEQQVDEPVVVAGPSAEQLEELRLMLASQWQKGVDTATLRRFLVAVGGRDKAAVRWGSMTLGFPRDDSVIMAPLSWPHHPSTTHLLQLLHSCMPSLNA